MKPLKLTTEPSIEQEAAEWVLRRDRGLTPAEQDEFLQWQSSDPRHAAAHDRHRRNWSRLDVIADWRPQHADRPNRDLLAPAAFSRWHWIGERKQWLVPMGLAAAAVIALILTSTWSESPPSAAVVPSPAPSTIAILEQRTLDDGSTIELNRGAQVSVLYTPAERRVRLEAGEAHFHVAKNAARPFIVSVGEVDVRAVGTAFNVRRESSAVEVLVTEGTVKVTQPTEASASVPEPTVLTVGQSVTVPLAPAPLPQVEKLSATEVESRLAWQPRLLDFTDEPLYRVVGEFNRHNAPIKLMLADPQLAQTQVSASLRSDNVEGFIRLLEAGFGVQSERSGDTVTLRRKR